MKQKGVIMPLLFILVLSGCMYPAEQRVENQVPYPAQIEAVQFAVNQYEAQRGVLPIKDFDAETSLYDRYIIRFQELVPQYMERPPGNAFEAGGVFQYVLVDVEAEPTVKLRDVRLSQSVRDVQIRLNVYLNRGAYLPWKEMLTDGYFTLDYEKLDFKKEPLVESPYTRQLLPLIVDQYGQVGIDYRSDINQKIEELELSEQELEQIADLREVLIDDSPFVPIHSFPYQYRDGEVVVARST